MVGGLAVLTGWRGVAAAVSEGPVSASAFEATSVDKAIMQLYGVPAKPSASVILELPVFAEAREVPVSVSTELPKVSEIAILVTQNKSPLVAVFRIAAMLEPNISTHITIERSPAAKNDKYDVIALVRTADDLYMATADVIIQSDDGCSG